MIVSCTPILPTRHGNSCLSSTSSLFIVNSDPTYEAWKLAFGFKYVGNLFTTPILPTRHGNSSHPPPSRSSSQATPILPTRHGNSPTSIKSLSVSLLTPILPTRHGNPSTHPQNNLAKTILRSYLRGMETQCRTVFVWQNKRHSDPTYEAWKHTLFDNACFVRYLLRSYLRGMETIT